MGWSWMQVSDQIYEIEEFSTKKNQKTSKIFVKQASLQTPEETVS